MNQEAVEQINGLLRNLDSNVSTRKFDMIITNKRILLIRTKSQFTDGIKLWGGVPELVYEYLSKRKQRKIPQKTLDEALAAHRKNKSIPLSSIKSVMLKKHWGSTDIWIYQAKGKTLHFQVNTESVFDQWRQILGYALPNKLVF